MKTTALVLGIFAILFFSCSKEEETSSVNQNTLIGEWQSTDVFENDDRIEEESNVIKLTLTDDLIFHKNSMYGKWSVQTNKITLFPVELMSMPVETYEITEVDEVNLILRKEIKTADSNKQVVRIEKFKRL